MIKIDMTAISDFHILVAEDDDSIRELLIELLTIEGYSCEAALDGLDASEKLQTGNFQLLISDFRMPKMDGVDLLKWCRGNNIHIPIIFITANKDLESFDIASLDQYKAIFLKKPLEFEELFSAIEKSRQLL